MADLTATTVRLLDDTGTLVLNLTETAGYELVALDEGERRWRRTLVTGPDVEGDVETQAVLDSRTYGITVRVKAASEAQLTARKNALIAAVEPRAWRLQIDLEGQVDTFAARRADTTVSLDRVDLWNRQRLVQVRVPVQPRPL